MIESKFNSLSHYHNGLKSFGHIGFCHQDAYTIIHLELPYVHGFCYKAFSTSVIEISPEQSYEANAVL